MTSKNKQMYDDFQLVFNNLSSNLAPGLDIFEISMYLTKAYFTFVSQTYEQYEKSEAARKALTELVTNVKLAPYNFTDASDYQVTNESTFFKLPTDLLYIVYEQVQMPKDVPEEFKCLKGKNLEATKYYSNLDTPDGWLIREFMDTANYRTYITKWSCLDPRLRGHEFEVCGVDWWQGSDPDTVGGRMKWVRQIYGNDQLCPSRVFAPEICPFHSPKFPTSRLERLIGFIKERVIVPAARAVIENGLPFAVAVGKSYAEVLTALGACQEKEWSPKTPMKGWPKNQNGSPVNRTYGLYSFDVDGVGCARFLVTYAPGGNNLPRADFAPVEAVIRQFAK